MDLKRLFEYDLWANRLWLPVILEAGSPEEEKVLRHILSAQAAWLKRCQGEVLTAMPQLPLTEESLLALNRGWMEILATRDMGEQLTYRRLDGEEHVNTLDEIASHVVNHGTYHRGHLRGLMQGRGFEAFPETDLIKMARLR